MENMDDNEKIAEELFGKVQTESQSESTALTDEDLIKLTSLVETEKEAINVFCVGHHSVFPISLEGREELARRAGAEETADWKGKYFQVSVCPFCSEDHRYENPTLKDFRAS